MLEQGSNVDRGYATVADDDGINYRDIADTMSSMGLHMNHSSARNYVIRVMKKFATEIAGANGRTLDEKQLNEVAKSPMFQSGVSDLLHAVEMHRRDER